MTIDEAKNLKPGDMVKRNSTPYPDEADDYCDEGYELVFDELIIEDDGDTAIFCHPPDDETETLAFDLQYYDPA